MNGIGGRTVAEAKRRLTLRAFEKWKQFYLHFPFDDLHRYHRPAALVAATLGGKYEEKIEFLEPKPVIEAPASTGKRGRYSTADMAVINAMANRGR